MNRYFSPAAICVLLSLVPLQGCGGPAATSAGEGTTPASPGHDEAGTSASADNDPLHPRVELHTTAGLIVVELDAQHAPATVENFLRYVREGHYNHTIFHHVERDYVVLGGGYTRQLYVRRGRSPIRNESDNGLKNVRGSVAMAREPDHADSATCQFFINVVDNPELDYRGSSPDARGYCVFGRVIQGMDVVDRISRVKVRRHEGFSHLPVKTVLIQRAVELR
jgi:peptidyl-prolyl cis-trans isomerase B (cyclophilin B)